MVTNLSVGEEFVLNEGVASIDIPEGMVLAPTAQAQSASVDFPDVPAGESRTVDWFVRGDVEGNYNIGASYAGLLQPFGDPISIRAASATPLHVWGGSAFKLTVDADDRADSTYPYHVSVGVENVADVEMYNVSLELLKKGKLNYIYQPREQLAVSTDTLSPGESLKKDYILVPTISGSIDLADSFVSYSSGLEFTSADLTAHPQVNPPESAPQLDAVALDHKVGLTFDPVPGATSYAIYSTNDPTVDFNDDPDEAHVVPATGTGRLRAWVGGIDPGSPRHFAVSPLVDGRPLMSHPLTTADANSNSSATTVSYSFDTPSGTEHTCGVDGPFDVTLTFNDDFGLGTYEYQVTDAVGSRSFGPSVVSDGALDKSITVSVDLTGTPTAEAELKARATNIAGDVGAWETVTMDKKCGYRKVVVLAAGLNSFLDSDESTTVALDPTCPDPAMVRDGFNNGFASNACAEKYFGDPKDRLGNLVAYLKTRGYDPGVSRSSAGRTLLEFSYEGAEAPDPKQCGPGAEDEKPTLVPNSYGVGATYESIVGELDFPQSIGRARNYFSKLVDYDQCWRKAYGEALDVTIIGHSLGGYQALALARLAAVAANEGKSTIKVSGVLTIDGAIQPSTVYRQFGAGDCFINSAWIGVPAES